MNCIIIEDQPPAQRVLKKYISDMGTLTLKATFSDAMQSMPLLKVEKIDLIFLDIHLPKLSGIDFLKSLPNPPHIILTTAFPDYALESYDLNVVDYLLKPFSFQRFVKAVSKIPSPTPPSYSTYKEEMFIKSGYEHIKITIAHIQYIKSDTDYTFLYMAEHKYLTSESLRYWEEHLDPGQFVRVHKSYIVNAAHITKISSNQIFMSNEDKIPIGRSYKEDFVARFLN